MVTTVPDWFMILGLLGLSTLAVFVLVTLRAVGCKSAKPGWAWVFVPVGLLVGLSMLAGWLNVEVPNALAWNQQGMISPVGFQVANSLPFGNDGIELNVPHVRISVTGLFLILMLVLVVLREMRRSSGTPDQCARRRGWGKAVLLLLIVFVGAKLWSANSHQDLSYYQEQARQEMEKAKQKLKEASEKIKQANDDANAADQPSMHQLWNELNKPRIQIEAEAPTAVMKTTVDGQAVKLEAKANDGAKAVVDSKIEEQPADTAAAAEAKAAEVKAPVEPATNEKNADKQTVADKETDRVAATTGSQIADDQPLADSQPDENQRRPAWVDEPPKRVGNLWREVIVAGDYATTTECYKATDDMLSLATWEHIQQLAGVSPPYADGDASDRAASDLARVLPQAHSTLRAMNVSMDYIRHEIAKDEYVETVDRSVGPMKRLYTLVEFSPSVDSDLRQRWEAYERESRLMAVGGLGGLVVGAVGLAYGLLKVDTWTKGYYTKRLFLGVPAAIIGLIALAAAFGF